MKKIFTIMLVFGMSTFLFSQGTETFDNYPETGNSYKDGTFLGQDGSTWTYVQCRGDQSITGVTPGLGKERTPDAEIYSGTISGGVGTLSFDYMQMFSTGVNLEVYVDGVLVATVTSDSETGIVKPSGEISVGIGGDVVIRFYNPAGGQVAIDNVVWTGQAAVIKPEPSNHVTDFLAANPAEFSIDLSWTGSVGETLPKKYLIVGKTETGTYPTVIDSMPVEDDMDWSNGSAAVNIPHKDGSNSYNWTSLTAATSYSFRIYPLSNSGADIDYKTDGIIPEVSETTGAKRDTILFEDFESSTHNFTDYNVIGDQTWYLSSSNYMKMSGYVFSDGRAYDNEDWLITPGLQFDRSTDESIEFISIMNYGTPGDGSLTFWISTDYDGESDPNGFIWVDLTSQVTLSAGGWASAESGVVDVSEYSGTVYFAWKYLSTDAEAATWEIDDVLVKGFISNMAPIIHYSTIEHLPTVPNGDEDVKVTVNVEDDDQGALVVEIAYIVNDGGINVVAMTNDSTTYYSYTLANALYNDGDIVGFQIRAHDVSGDAEPSFFRGFFVGDADIEIVREVNPDGTSDFEDFNARLSGILTASIPHFGSGINTHTALQVSVDQGIVLINWDSTMVAEEGDSVQIIGELGFYNGLLQLDVFEYTVLKTDTEVPEANELLLSDFIGDFDASEYYEGSLLVIRNVEISSVDDGAWGTGDARFTVTDDGGTTSMTMRIVEEMGFWPIYPTQPTGSFDVVAVLGQYDFSSPYTSGYQLLPVDFPTLTDIADDETGLPQKFEMSQNYPNPFNPTTSVKFALPQAEEVTFSIYNVLGQRVFEHVKKYNAGVNVIEFSAESLSSGVYFYRIQAGQYKAIKKMILMK